MAETCFLNSSGYCFGMDYHLLCADYSKGDWLCKILPLRQPAPNIVELRLLDEILCLSISSVMSFFVDLAAYGETGGYVWA